MKNVNWKDVAVRAVKTFIEAAVAFAGTELAGMDVFAIDKRVWCAVGISAAAAGVSAIWNGMIEPVITPLLASRSEGD